MFKVLNLIDNPVHFVIGSIKKAAQIRELSKLSDQQLRDAGIDLSLVRTRAAESCPAVLGNLLSLR